MLFGYTNQVILHFSIEHLIENVPHKKILQIGLIFFMQNIISFLSEFSYGLFRCSSLIDMNVMFSILRFTGGKHYLCFYYPCSSYNKAYDCNRNTFPPRST